MKTSGKNASTKNTLIGRIADYFGMNKKFHEFLDDNICLDPDIVISPVEATLVNFGKINADGKIISKSKTEIKLNEVIGNYADLFRCGIYFNFYLSPKNRHYWKIPYNCKLVSTKINNGKAIIPVLIGLDNLFDGNNYFAKAIQKNASIGLVFKTKTFYFAMIPVGSLNVNGIHVVNDSKGKYKKGDIGGYFSIGSSMLLCFPDHLFDMLIDIGEKVHIGDTILRLRL